jgi:hypothetical protein
MYDIALMILNEDFEADFELTCCITTLISITTLIGSKLDLSSTMTTTARAKTSFIYHVMCLEARFYDYLASSEVKKKLSSKLVTVAFAS